MAWSTGRPDGHGGAEGDRTPDLLIANEALSQLSYGPVRRGPDYGCGLHGCQAWGGLRPAAAVARVPARRGKPGGGLAMTSILLLVIWILDIYKWVLIAAAVLSWLIAFDVLNKRSRAVYMIADFLNRVTEPVLRPIRRILPSLGGVDVSPIIALLLVWFIQDLIVRNLL